MSRAYAAKPQAEERFMLDICDQNATGATYTIRDVSSKSAEMSKIGRQRVLRKDISRTSDRKQGTSRMMEWRRDYAWLMISRCSRSLCQIQVRGTSSNQAQTKKSMITTTYSQEKVKSTS
ncbi:hypothetical protein Tco_0438243 [Tanacetum coccineum]